MQNTTTVEIPTITADKAVKLMHKYTVIIHKCMQNHRENTYKLLHNYTTVGTAPYPPHPATYREGAGRKKEKEGKRFYPSATSYYI